MTARETDRTMFFAVSMIYFLVLYIIWSYLFEIYQERFVRLILLFIIFSTRDFAFDLPNGISSRTKSPILTLYKKIRTYLSGLTF